MFLALNTIVFPLLLDFDVFGLSFECFYLGISDFFDGAKPKYYEYTAY